MSSSTFVMVTLKESKKKSAKRAMLPPSINSLKLQAAKLFNVKPPQKIQAIYDPEGNLITTISEIIPGMEITVSTNLPDEDFSVAQDETPVFASTQSNLSPKSSVYSSAKKVPPPPMSGKASIISGSPVRNSPRSSEMASTAYPQSSPLVPAPNSNDAPPSPFYSSRQENQSSASLIRNTSGLAIISQVGKTEINQNPNPKEGSPLRVQKKQPKKEEEEEIPQTMLSEEELERLRLLEKGIIRENIMQLTEQALGPHFDEIVDAGTFKTALDNTTTYPKNDDPIIVNPGRSTEYHQ